MSNRKKTLRISYVWLRVTFLVTFVMTIAFGTAVSKIEISRFTPGETEKTKIFEDSLRASEFFQPLEKSDVTILITLYTSYFVAGRVRLGLPRCRWSPGLILPKFPLDTIRVIFHTETEIPPEMVIYKELSVTYEVIKWNVCLCNEKYYKELLQGYFKDYVGEEPLTWENLPSRDPKTLFRVFVHYLELKSFDDTTKKFGARGHRRYKEGLRYFKLQRDKFHRRFLDSYNRTGWSKKTKAYRPY